MNDVLGTLLFALSISLPTAAAPPQWTKLRDPSGGSVLSISASAARPGLLVLGSHEGGAWHSVDDGRSWELRSDWPRRFFDLSLDPTDPSRALAVEEGFFMESSDAGVHWTHFDFDLQKGELDLAVAHDPAVPGRAYAVASGWYIDGGYLFRSNDHGGGWSEHPLPYWPLEADLHVLPVTGTILIATPGVLLRSTDEGTSFTEPIDSTIEFVSAHPMSGGVVWAGRSDALFRSLDDGASWLPVTPPTSESPLVGALADSQDPAAVLVATRSHGLWRSLDGGASWSATSDLPAFVAPILHRSPFDEDVVFAASQAGVGVWRSEDRGQTFVAASRGPGDSVRGIFFDETTVGHVLVLGSTTLHESHDGGVTWHMHLGWPETGFRIDDVAIDPSGHGPWHAIDGARERLLQSFDAGVTWEHSSFPYVNPAQLRIGPDGTIFVAHGARSVARSTDGGSTWTTALAGKLPVAFAGSAQDPLVVHQAAENGYWRTEDGGASWQRADNLPLLGFVDVAVDASDPARVYLIAGGSPPRFLASADGGATWDPAGAGLHYSLHLARVAVDPHTSGRILVAARNWSVWKSENHRANFALFQSGLPPDGILDVAFDPHAPGHVWAATERAEAWYLETMGGDLYAFDFGCPDPVPYCQAKLNSLGTLPVLRWLGEPSVSGGDFAVTVDFAVPSQAMIGFFSAAGPDSRPFFGGELCLRDPLHRFGAGLLDSSGSGRLDVPLDAGLVGTTQWFQCVYRDPFVSDGTGVGLTDGLAVLFCE